MSKFVVINNDTRHSYGCICDRCVKRAARILRNPGLGGYCPPPFDLHALFDFSRMPWPDEIMAKKKEGGK